MFEGFAVRAVEVADGVRLRVRVGGAGPPVVLLHGHPRTHTTWHRVAPLLVAAGHTVICPDLRGYGRSTAPPAQPDHAQAGKRAMAGDVLTLMRQLGHDRFAMAGHDRGSYVAFRLAMDHPDAVSHLAVLDSVPIGEALARADARFAASWWHWFFLAQPELPERLIAADPDAWYGTGPDRAATMGEGNYADYLRAIHDPAVQTAMIEDYRAGLGVDRAADDADRTVGRRLACPTLVAWSTQDDLQALYGDVPAVWRPWAPDLRALPIHSGHHMAEDAPEELAAALADFLDSPHVNHGQIGGHVDLSAGPGDDPRTTDSQAMPTTSGSRATTDGIKIRPSEWPDDQTALNALDTSYDSELVLQVQREKMSFHLVATAAPVGHRHHEDTFKSELSTPGRPWTTCWSAVDPSGRLVGVAATGFESWNRRQRLWYLGVERTARGLGVGRRLLDHVQQDAQRLGADHLFLETPNVNATAIAFYRRLGFQIVGLDTSMYAGTQAAGQTAIYLALPLEAGRGPDAVVE